MKKVVSLFALCALLCVSVSAAFAEDKATDKKSVTLKGTAVCAKCELKQTESCQDALKVTEDGKDVVYLLTDNAVSKAYHKEVCHGPKENVSVTGVVTEVDGKKMIEATKIE